MKKTKLLLVALLVLLCGCLLCSCFSEDEPNEPAGEEEWEDMLMAIEPFGDEPYHIYYTSNGDGTCYVSDITTNPKNTENFTLVIPEKSPEGDTVTSISCKKYAAFRRGDTPNIPYMLTEQAYKKMIEIVESHSSEESKEVLKALHAGQAYLRWDVGELGDNGKVEVLKEFPLAEYAVIYVWNAATSPDRMVYISDALTQYSAFAEEDKKQVYSELFELTKANFSEEDFIFALDYLRCRDTKYMTGVEFPSTLDIIGYSAFENCTSLGELTIPDGVTRIEQYAFNGCTGLASITIPNSVAEIEPDSFQNCTRLASVALPDRIIHVSCFANCTALTDITIPDSVTLIGLNAFGGCTSLTSITLPNKVTCISVEAFSGCTALTSITIPNSVTEINSYAFEGCSNLESIYFDGTYAEFQAIDKGEDWTKGCPVQFVICTDRDFWIVFETAMCR